MTKYALGIDYGTLSVRALVVKVENGEEVATCAYDYPHGVMDEALPCGKKLGVDWALQHPADYLEAMQAVVPRVLQEAGVEATDIVGVGVDFTACTIMPVKQDATPLCLLPEYAEQPHAYVKLWKHHAAQDQANRLNAIAHQRKEPWIQRYGGKISSEWMIPKIWQILEEAPQVYDAAERIMEAGDWIVWVLTGQETRNSCSAGYKSIWHKQEGFPSAEFFKALDERLEHVVEEKLNPEILPIGSRAGVISKRGAALTGLREGTPVATGHMDAHVCMPAVKIDGPGKMLAIMGTSTCHLVMGKEERLVPGICGYVEDGMMPGYFGYEGGQSCVGDHFAWFVEHCVPESYREEARKKGCSIHTYLQEKADMQKPGESGLVALDWWNGNRSVLVDVDLTGVMVGMTLATKPEEIYRALVEATAYGTRMIIETMEAHGVAVEEYIAAGGIAEKSSFMMQIYADIIKKPIRISGSAQGPALGAAIFGAVAAGAEQGGYDDIYEAARKMGKLKEGVLYEPIHENAVVYDRLFAEYKALHDYFGRGMNDVMKRLKALRREQRS